MLSARRASRKGKHRHDSKEARKEGRKFRNYTVYVM